MSIFSLAMPPDIANLHLYPLALAINARPIPVFPYQNDQRNHCTLHAEASRRLGRSAQAHEHVDRAGKLYRTPVPSQIVPPGRSLPLFSASREETKGPEILLYERLLDIDIDALSPREALEKLYDLSSEARAAKK